MTSSSSGSSNCSGSAKIYTFPPRGRFAASDQGEGFEPTTAVQLPPGVKLASGSAWYHDEAIQQSMQAEPRRKS